MTPEFISQFAKIFPEFNLLLGSGVMVFARMVGFMRYAPVLNRKEIPSFLRLALALILTIVILLILKPQAPPPSTSILLCIVLNFAFGAIIGYIGECIISAIQAGGDMINTQMGLSSAMVLDPTTQSQVSIMGRYFGFIGLLIFMEIGGMYWLINAFIRSFTLFGVHGTSLPLSQVLNIDYLIIVSSNVLFVGMQIAAPVLLATLGQDIILGIISKTAPQVNVFQLSFLFKPVLGAAILIWILPILINVITDYFNSYSQIF